LIHWPAMLRSVPGSPEYLNVAFIIDLIEFARCVEPLIPLI
jgi:hypothetical protein